MYRHIRETCKSPEHSAKSDDPSGDFGEQLANQQHQIEKLRSQLEKIEARHVPRISANSVKGAATIINTGPITIANTVANTVANANTITNTIGTAHINVRPYDGEGRLIIPVDLVKAAFAENPRLAEFCQLSDGDKSDTERAAPYVLETLVDLIRRAHRDPISRNVFLSPNRADQVMVHVGLDGKKKGPGPAWDVRPLTDVIRQLFDGVATNLHRIIASDRDRMQLAIGVQGAASLVPNLYEYEPDRFVRDGKGPMVAHLTSMALRQA